MPKGSMSRLAWLLGAALAFGAVAGATADTKTVHFATCTFAGVEAGCVEARSDRVVYNVTAAHVGPNAWLQGTGVLSTNLSYCQQGGVITDFHPDPDPRPQPCAAGQASATQKAQ